MIFLYGAPASGKTTLGRRLAAALGCCFADLDEEIVKAAGKAVPQIFAESGEAGFREIESRTLEAVVADLRGRGMAIVSLGGGTLLRQGNRALCESAGTVICLETPSEEELARRIGKTPGSRPLGDRARERADHYASFGSRIAATFDLENSLVVVGKGISGALLCGTPYVADSNVAALWAERLGTTPLDVIPSGEEHKTISTVTGLWSAFAGAGLGRNDVVAAVGGGVTGDLTGFAAATFMRGIAWMNFPTTLLAMVDASTGGKTGCDLPEGKNLAGAFHSPRLVAIDADFLSTLPQETLSCGRAEMVKHEIIGGVLTHSKGAASAIPSPAELAANLSVKVGIVKEDPFERKGRRILLNCGHTVAHAVETLTDYRVPHGAAVAIGCVEEAKLAVRLGLAPKGWPEELAARFSAYGLNPGLPEGLSPEKLVPVMKMDKKRSGGVVTFALPCGWGDVRAVPVDFSGKEVAPW